MYTLFSELLMAQFFPHPSFQWSCGEKGGSWVCWGSLMGNKHRDLKNSMSQLSLHPKIHSLPYFKSALKLFWITEDHRKGWCAIPGNKHRFQVSGSGMIFAAGLSLLSILSFYRICACFHPRVIERLGSWGWTWSLGLRQALSGLELQPEKQ